MTYDLQQRLRDLEQHAPTGTLDAALIDRLATRRRRGRAAGTSALSVAVLAAVAVAAAGGLTAPTKTATPPSGPPQCGDAMPAARAGASTVDLTLDDFASARGNTGIAPVTRVTVALEPTLRRDGAYTVNATYLVADGTIVAADYAPGSSDAALDQWSAASETTALPTTGCSGAPLPDGEYETYVYRTFVPMAGGAEEVTVGGGAPVRIAGGVAVPAVVDTPGVLSVTPAVVDAGQPAVLSGDFVTGGQALDVQVALDHPRDGQAAFLQATVVVVDASGTPTAAGRPSSRLWLPSASPLTLSPWASAGAVRDLATGAPVAAGPAHLRVDVTGYLVDTTTREQTLVGASVDLGEVALP